jgi:hypothetical protein
MAFYNVSRVRNFASTDPRIDSYAGSFPNNDAERAHHLTAYGATGEKRTLKEAAKAVALRNKHGASLRSWAVGDLIGIFSIPSDSELDSVSWDVATVNGFTGNLVLVDAAGTATALAGTKHSRVNTTSTTAAGANGSGVGTAVGKNVLLTPDTWVGPVRYVALEITALPSDWATCPVLPDVYFEVRSTNHLNSFQVPNV